MSSLKTNHLSLHRWLREDFIFREEFNDNFHKIDTAIQQEQERLTALNATVTKEKERLAALDAVVTEEKARLTALSEFVANDSEVLHSAYTDQQVQLAGLWSDNHFHGNMYLLERLGLKDGFLQFAGDNLLAEAVLPKRTDDNAPAGTLYFRTDL